MIQEIERTIRPMNLNFTNHFATAAGVILMLITSCNAPVKQQPFEPSFESLMQYKCPEWFRDAKFGIWAHWGVQSVPQQGDWYARKMYQEGSDDYKYHVAHYGHPSKFGFKDLIPQWKAEKFDPERLMSLYKALNPI